MATKKPVKKTKAPAKKPVKKPAENTPAKETKAPKAAGARFPAHGRTYTGIVVSDRMTRTVTVAWERRYYVPKYQRYERRYSKVKAHNPDEVDAKMGDKVTIMETRPISKTKNFTVIRKEKA